MPRELTKEISDAEATYQRHRGELTRLLEEYKTADAKEKNELRSEINELKEQIAEDKKAKEKKEKAEGTGGTLVLPPEQVPQQQHHGDKPGDTVASQQQQPNGKKRGRGWRSAW